MVNGNVPITNRQLAQKYLGSPSVMHIVIVWEEQGKQKHIGRVHEVSPLNDELMAVCRDDEYGLWQPAEIGVDMG